MGAAVAVTRSELTPAQLRSAACASEEPAQVRRLLAIALVLEGMPRQQAAEQCGMDRQTLRDWVHRYNEGGVAGLRSPACYAYWDNYLIDVDHAVIVDVEATTAVRQAEVGAAQTMLTRTAETFGLWPERLIADTGHGSAAMLGWLGPEAGAELDNPVFGKLGRKGGTVSPFGF